MGIIGKKKFPRNIEVPASSTKETRKSGMKRRMRNHRHVVIPWADAPPTNHCDARLRVAHRSYCSDGLRPSSTPLSMGYIRCRHIGKERRPIRLIRKVSDWFNIWGYSIGCICTYCVVLPLSNVTFVMTLFRQTGQSTGAELRESVLIGMAAM